MPIELYCHDKICEFPTKLTQGLKTYKHYMTAVELSYLSLGYI